MECFIDNWKASVKSDKTTIQSVRGVKDILPADIPLWRMVEDAAMDIFELYNFQEIRTPVFEKTEVFSRSIGETSDIVEKEMYTFLDRGEESLTLRPEGTASIARAFVERNMGAQPGVTKLYYMGPMFRAERPQAGRFRQFHQIGAEAFGSADPAADAEMIMMLMDFFTELNVTGLKVSLNSLGCSECRPKYRQALYEFLSARSAHLCDNCQGRVERNPLRALDCKSEKCKTTTADAPTIDQFRCEACQEHLEGVRKPLRDLELPVFMDNRLVRGLDYYNRTAFEVTSDRLGAQSAVAGGGRYDGLVAQFGGPPTPAIGFAIGIERLVSLLGEEARERAAEYYDMRPDVYMIPMSPEAGMKIFELSHRLRSNGYRVERGFDGGSMKSQFRKADRSGAMMVIILGEDELKQNSVTVKDMESGAQKLVPINDLMSVISKGLDEEPGE
ncbi:MAG: histidine--tRNA ligase [Nitrospinae bacterium]|nr:histidine--tRNA ligase [Nitrospinota bacterium]